MSQTRANIQGTQLMGIAEILHGCVKEIYPSEFRNWPILSLLKPEFITRISMIMVYGNGGNRALIVTKQDKNVYALDYNDFKTGDTHTGLYPKKINELCGKNIKTFACNSYFILALTEEGEVYSWGFNNKRKLDSESHIPVLASTPTRVIGLSEKCIEYIACGSGHSLALTSDGKVYAWGANKYGQVGNENTNIVDVPPRQVKHELEGKKIVRIACGSMFNMVVTDKGKLYGWGDNESGQISIDITPNFTDESTGSTLRNIQSKQFYTYPHEITAVSGKAIVKVACGFEHTLALTNEGKLYAWGKNDKGQVGVNNEQESSAPVMVDMPELVSDIAACGNLSVAVGKNDETVYVWGDCFDEIITTPFPTVFSSIHDAFAYTTTSIMHKPLDMSTKNNYVKLTLNKFESLGPEFLKMLFNDWSTSDFTIQVQGQPIHVHKSILQIRCQYFRNKFQRDETNQSLPRLPTYIVNKFSYIVYKAFLKYLYTGIVDFPADLQVLELMKLADEYRETNLKKEIIKCDWIIEQAITSSNVLFFYGKAIECEAKKVEEICFKFALDHLKDVVLSEEYIKLDTNIKDNFMRRAAKENAFRT